MSKYPDSELFEKLAAIEHERWSDWQKYLHSKCVEDDGSNLVIVKSLKEHWERQINTSYKDLSETEKNSDRDQVMRYWDLLTPK